MHPLTYINADVCLLLRLLNALVKNMHQQGLASSAHGHCVCFLTPSQTSVLPFS